MKTAASGIDVANKFVDIIKNPSLSKKFPAIAGKLLKLGKFASLLGPAGTAVGIACDLLSAFGLVEDGVLAKLDQISQQIEDLKDDVCKGFESMQAKQESMQALLQFLPIYNKIQAQVEIFELHAREDIRSDPIALYNRFDAMVKTYSPDSIIIDLKQMHLLISGGAFGLPLFEQLAKEIKGPGFEGEKFDDSMTNLFAQFRAVIALEIRAVRMLRSFPLYTEKDVDFGKDVIQILKDIAEQRNSRDPVQYFDWYLDFMCKGGRFEMKALKPDSYLYMEWGNHCVSGWSTDPGPKGKLNMTPCEDDGGTFLITCEYYPKELLRLNDDSNDGDVKSGQDKSDKLAHWVFHVVDIDNRIFKLRTTCWKNQFVYMQNDAYTEIRGTSNVESCGDQAKFKLLKL